MAGGPPCQPFSRAGSSKIRDLVRSGVRSENDDRVALWRSFMGVVEALRPRVVLLENVPDMARWNDGAVLIAILDVLRELGYSADARVLKAWEFGVPQHRARLFVVGTSRQFQWPRRRPPVTLRDAIGDLPAIAAGTAGGVPGLPARPDGVAVSACGARAVCPPRALMLSMTTAVATSGPMTRRRSPCSSPGRPTANCPERLRRYRVDIFDDKYKRLVWDDLSRSITAHIAKDGYWYIHPEQDRTLSIREAARIQTFPDSFRFAGHPTVQFRQIGNAVPPALARSGRSSPEGFA